MSRSSSGSVVVVAAFPNDIAERNARTIYRQIRKTVGRRGLSLLRVPYVLRPSAVLRASNVLFSFPLLARRAHFGQYSKKVYCAIYDRPTEVFGDRVTTGGARVFDFGRPLMRNGNGTRKTSPKKKENQENQSCVVPSFHLRGVLATRKRLPYGRFAGGACSERSDYPNAMILRVAKHFDDDRGERTFENGTGPSGS